MIFDTDCLKTLNSLIMKSFSPLAASISLFENNEILNMRTFQTVRCPNCGSFAERDHLAADQHVRTQCPTCDYLMVTCSRTGRVVEAYAPGIAFHR